MAMDFAYPLENNIWDEESIACLPEEKVLLIGAVPKAWYDVELEGLLGFPSMV